MAYGFTNSKGTTYYLHAKKIMSTKGKERTLFFFAKEVKEGALDVVPAGYNVVEMKTGLPVLKKNVSEVEAKPIVAEVEAKPIIADVEVKPAETTEASL